VLEMLQTRHQQRARNARQSALNLVEMAAAGQQFTHDQRRPAIREDLRCTRDWAVLTVLEHRPIVLPPGRGVQSENWTRTGPILGLPRLWMPAILPPHFGESAGRPS